MATTIRPEVSEKNKYWMEKHRYYELKHFCLQYPIWKKAYDALDGLSKRPSDLEVFRKEHNVSDPTAKCVEAKDFYLQRIEMIEKAAKETDSDLWNYILKAVTMGYSYNSLRTLFNIPCCKDTYYELYRRFFYILNKMRE